MKDPDFSEFPILTTAGLILRKVSLGDAQVIHQLRSDIEVVRLIGKKPFTTLDEAITYIKRIESLVSNNECIFWGISYGNSTELIGVICFWNFDILNETVEIGYELLPEFQGKGIDAIAADREIAGVGLGQIQLGGADRIVVGRRVVARNGVDDACRHCDVGGIACVLGECRRHRAQKGSGHERAHDETAARSRH